jgi:hypothetical protein
MTQALSTAVTMDELMACADRAGEPPAIWVPNFGPETTFSIAAPSLPANVDTTPHVIEADRDSHE